MSLPPDSKFVDSPIECEIPFDPDMAEFSGSAKSSKGLELITPQQFVAGSILVVSIVDGSGHYEDVTAVVAASEPSHCHPGSYFTTIAFVDELAGGLCECLHSEENAVVLQA